MLWAIMNGCVWLWTNMNSYEQLWRDMKCYERSWTEHNSTTDSSKCEFLLSNKLMFDNTELTAYQIRDWKVAALELECV